RARGHDRGSDRRSARATFGHSVLAAQTRSRGVQARCAAPRLAKARAGARGGDSMSDPPRLLDEHGLDDAERRALRAARGEAPPEEARREVWMALGAKLPTIGAAASGAASNAAAGGSPSVGTTGSAMMFVKALAVGVTMGGMFVGARTMWPHPSRS